MRRFGKRETADPPRVGMRVWLGVAFAAIGVLTAGSVYLIVRDSSERVLSDRSGELAVGRTISLADQVGVAKAPAAVIAGAQADGFRAWYFDRVGRLVAPKPAGPGLREIKAREQAIGVVLDGGRYRGVLPGGDVSIVAVPVFRGLGISGVVLGRYSSEEVLSGALGELRDDSLRGLAIAIAISVIGGFIIASLIAFRIKRLALSAEEMAQGRLDVPLQVSGRDEIGDLARALDSMRSSLNESFGVLTSDRDKLNAIFDGLTDAVMVVDDEGKVRFANSAAQGVTGPGDRPPEAMVPHLRRAAETGFAAHPSLRIGDRAYAIQIRDLPAERAVLAVVRDRTVEMRKEWAERDFVSNAAHELRNPLAGISGAIEVLQGGAKDDLEARDHFLGRLSADAERMSRLIQSLLALARVEATGPSEVEIVDVSVAVSDVIATVEKPDGINLTVDVGADIAAQADPTLLRQVLIGLLSNAYKNTPTPGDVAISARRGEEEGELVLEVADTGTGIPEAEIGRVFERFYRRPESRKQEGFGLGLAIARRMVDVMGGTIGASSQEGRGSTFWVRLPVAAPSPTPIA